MSAKSELAKNGVNVVVDFFNKGSKNLGASGKKAVEKAEKVSVKTPKQNSRVSDIQNSKSDINVGDNRVQKGETPIQKSAQQDSNKTQKEQGISKKETAENKNRDLDDDTFIGAKTNGKKRDEKQLKDKRENSIDEMLNSRFGRDRMKDSGFRPNSHTGIFANYFNFKEQNSYLRESNSSGNISKLGNMLKGKMGAFGKFGSFSANVMAFSGGGLGEKSATLTSSSDLFGFLKKQNQEAKEIKNINVVDFANSLDIDGVLSPADLAEAIRQRGAEQDLLDITLRAINATISKESFINNVINLEKAVDSISKTFNVDKNTGELLDGALKEYNAFIKLNLPDYDSFNERQRKAVDETLSDFHRKIGNSGNIDFAGLTDSLKQHFSKEQISDITKTIDDCRKSETGYIAYNANVYAGLAEKRDEIKNIKELVGEDLSKRDLSKDEFETFINKRGYAGLMAVVKNMPVDDDINAKMKIAGLMSDKGVREAELINSLEVTNQANRLATLLEVSEMLKNGKVEYVDMLGNQEQLNMEKLLEYKPLKVNPFDVVGRGTFGVYFVDNNGELLSINSINIASAIEGKSNLGNILNFTLNNDSSIAVLEALKSAGILKSESGVAIFDTETANQTINRSLRDFKAENMLILNAIKNGDNIETVLNDINSGKTSTLDRNNGLINNAIKSAFPEFYGERLISDFDRIRISDIANFGGYVKQTFKDNRDDGINSNNPKGRFGSSEDLDLSAKMEIEPLIKGSDKEIVEQIKADFEATQQKEKEIKHDSQQNDKTKEQDDVVKKEKEQRELEQKIKQEQIERETAKREMKENIKNALIVATNVALCFTPAGLGVRGLILTGKAIQGLRTAATVSEVAVVKNALSGVENALNVVSKSKTLNNTAVKIGTDIAIAEGIEVGISNKM